MEIQFTKMHGLGNDFILIDCRSSEPEDLPALARSICDRRLGVGADQILLLHNSKTADFRMRIFNADGSEVEMCGNGIRCFAKYIWDRELSDKKTLKVETRAGIISPDKINGLIRVDMGEPVLEPEKIPVTLDQTAAARKLGRNAVIDYPLLIEDKEFKITCVSMGNPHAVIVVDNVSVLSVAYYGPMIEKHRIFPNRTNVEFIEVLNASEIKMRVWERGSGETMACGTGAAAAAVAASLKGLIARETVVHLPGGDLSIEWRNDNHVHMTGPAVETFRGTVSYGE